MDFIQSDERLMQLIKRKNLSKVRIDFYNIVFNELYHLFKKK